MTLHDYADRFDPFVAEAGIKPKRSYTKFFQEPRDRIGRALYRSDVDVFANAGDPEESCGYYLHIEPGNCYAGAALFKPSKAALARMRTRLIDDPSGLTAILDDPEFKKTFPDGIVTQKALGTVPEGFSCSDPAAPYLKMAGLGCRKDLPDALLFDDEVIDLLVEIFRAPARWCTTSTDSAQKGSYEWGCFVRWRFIREHSLCSRQCKKRAARN